MVIAIAITTGSGNSLEIKENVIKTFIPNNIARYKKFVKCTAENMANTPHCEFVSNVAPLKKYAENIMKMQVKKLFRNRSRYGG
jgi:hypothetical protein